MKSSTQKLENIDENGPARWLPSSGAAPETPTESMEFLARSWSLSAMELSKALSGTNIANLNPIDKSSSSSVSIQTQGAGSTAFRESPVTNEISPPISPRDSEEMKLYKSLVRGRTVGRWLKDQKERKKQEIRAHNAQLHAAVSVVGVAAAIAAITASDTTLQEMATGNQMKSSRTSAAVASAAALVASHCIEIAEDMGADHEQILTVVNSAINARTNGDIMTLTAGAATGVVSEVYCDIPRWSGREREDSSGQREYFGIKTADRIIEFECRNKGDKQMWIDGIQYMLNICANIR